MQNIHVTKHAIRRFRERSGAQYSEDKIVSKLLCFYQKSKRATLKRQYRVLALMDHNYTRAEYFDYNGWILVVVGNGEGKSIVTVHNNQSRRVRKGS